MSWYYSEGGEQRGPVTDADLDLLFKTGKIADSTLVWRQGMTDWQVYSAARGTTSSAPPFAGAPPANGVLCTECKRIFAADEVIRHGNANVCAECKPVFLQKLREGVNVTGSAEYAGFWTRFGAKFLDNLILRVVSWIIGLGTGFALRGTSPLAAMIVAGGLAIVIGAIYSIIFVGKSGATPGKMAAKILIVNADGTQVTYGKAAARYFAEIVSGLTLGIGYIMAAFDPEKRALHDRICGTRVIKR